MSITPREKEIVKRALDNGIVTEEELDDIGYFSYEVEEIKSDKNWFTLYTGLDDTGMVTRHKHAIELVLGLSWKDKYDYSEKRKRGRYSLDICVTDSEFNKICEAYMKGNIINLVLGD